MSLVRDVDISLSAMDCLYPRDPPQPVREKKTASVQHLSPQPEVTTAAPSTAIGGPSHSGPIAATLAPLSERIEALNYSLDPWERTGAAPQGWANHLQQSLLPIQGYIQLRPQTPTPLPEFGTTGLPSPVESGDTENAARTAPRRLGKASKSVSIFARDPLCKDTFAAIAEDDLVMLVLNTMTTPAMIVSSNSYTLREYLVTHGNSLFCRGASLGATDALPNDVLCVSPTIFTSACDVSISLRLIPPPWGVGILGLQHLTLDHCA